MVVTALLLAPAVVAGVGVFAEPALLLLCLPTTAAAVWLLFTVQRYRQVPVRVLLAALGWGALPAAGYSGLVNTAFVDAAAGWLFRPDQDFVTYLHWFYVLAFANGAPVEELSKGAGVAMLYLLARRHLSGIVAGTIVGAAVGLGFNLVETVQYMAGPAAVVEYQFFIRQSVALLGAHTAFSAAVGAGFGVATGLVDARARRLVIMCGFFAGIGTHFGHNTILRWYALFKEPVFSPSSTTDLLFLQPLLFVLLNGPLLVVCVLLVRVGLAEDRRRLISALEAEVATGTDVVTAPEVPVLVNPGLRRRVRWAVLSRHGWRAAARLGQVHAAQLALAADRIQAAAPAAPGRADRTGPHRAVLLRRVVRRKRLDPQPPAPVPVEISAAAT